MRLSLFDHDRRLHDLETALKAMRDLFIVEVAGSRDVIDQAARVLHARGETGAASLLRQASTGSGRR